MAGEGESQRLSCEPGPLTGASESRTQAWWRLPGGWSQGLGFWGRFGGTASLSVLLIVGGPREATLGCGREDGWRHLPWCGAPGGRQFCLQFSRVGDLPLGQRSPQNPEGRPRGCGEKGTPLASLCRWRPWVSGGSRRTFQGHPLSTSHDFIFPQTPLLTP